MCLCVCDVLSRESPIKRDRRPNAEQHLRANERKSNRINDEVQSKYVYLGAHVVREADEHRHREAHGPDERGDLLGLVAARGEEETGVLDEGEEEEHYEFPLVGRVRIVVQITLVD